MGLRLPSALSRYNPLKDFRQFKGQENELSYLTKEQIAALLVELKKSTYPHVVLLPRICLATCIY